MLYMVTWIPSIYPSHVSIFLPAPAGSYGSIFAPESLADSLALVGPLAHWGPTRVDLGETVSCPGGSIYGYPLVMTNIAMENQHL